MKSLFIAGLFAKMFRLEIKATPKKQQNAGAGNLRRSSPSDRLIQVRHYPVFSTDAPLFMRSQLG